MSAAYFEQIAQAVCVAPDGIDRVSLSYESESTDFIRFNQARVRQATHVEQHYATVSVVAGKRQASGTLALSGHADADARLVLAERARLIQDLPMVPEDAHLLLPESVNSTRHEAAGALPHSQAVIAAVAEHASGCDLVGIFTGGHVIRAFADSRGQRNWHRVESFLFDWCIYRQADQAVKTSYAGTHWDDGVFAAKVARAREQVELLALPQRKLEPGAYRAYFSPVAVADLLGTLSWGGFSHKAVKTGMSPLVNMHQSDAKLHAAVTLTEATADGIAPRFQNDGFVKPDATALIEHGLVAGTLVSPRTAREFGLQPTGAGSWESPDALRMAPGHLPEADVLQALGAGVYLSNLHYLNYSDRQACRMTGMTRFACFWVEDGKLVAPIAVMRFDDSFLRMFGEGLVALTDNAELVPDDATYGARALRSVTAPGAIVDGFRLTL